MRIRLGIVITIAAAGALALSLVSCGARAPAGITVATAPVAMGRLIQHVEFSGVLAPSQTATISSRISGLAKIVTVDIGSRVKAGELLVEIDTKELSAQSDVAEAALQLVRDQAAQAKTGIESAKANLDLAQKSYDRAATLITSQSITQGQFDDAQTKLDLAKTAYKNATQQYQLLSSSSLAQAQAQANLIQVQISHGVITSPIAGVVTNRNINPGEVVSANTQLMSIVDSSLLKLQGNVAQTIATLLTHGEKVKVNVEGMRNGEYEGAIIQVGPVAAATGQFFPVVVSVRNDGRLMAGMTALSSFDLQGPPTLLIPLSAITSSNGRAYAFVVSNGTAARRALHLGLESATQVEILGGLSSGEHVAISNVDTLQDGMTVQTTGQGGKL